MKIRDVENIPINTELGGRKAWHRPTSVFGRRNGSGFPWGLYGKSDRMARRGIPVGLFYLLWGSGVFSLAREDLGVALGFGAAALFTLYPWWLLLVWVFSD